LGAVIVDGQGVCWRSERENEWQSESEHGEPPSSPPTWIVAYGVPYRPKARMRSISRGCRSGARAWPRRAGGGLGCRSVPCRSRLYRLARLTPAIQVPTTARMIAPSTVIPMSEA
jgi:hypothetical protein